MPIVSMMSGFNPRFVCPQCGRAPARHGFLNYYAVEITDLERLIRPDGSLTNGLYECRLGHAWAVEPAAHVSGLGIPYDFRHSTPEDWAIYWRVRGEKERGKAVNHEV